MFKRGMGGDEAMPTTVMTLEEVATLLRVHPSTVYRLLRLGHLPAFKLGSDWRFRKESIEDWVKKQESLEDGGQLHQEKEDSRLLNQERRPLSQQRHTNN
jgi:excisionase family DNA binding protein